MEIRFSTNSATYMLLNILKLRFFCPFYLLYYSFLGVKMMIQRIINPVAIMNVLMSLKYQVTTIAMITMNQFVAVMQLPMVTNVMLKMQASKNG